MTETTSRISVPQAGEDRCTEGCTHTELPRLWEEPDKLEWIQSPTSHIEAPGKRLRRAHFPILKGIKSWSNISIKGSNRENRGLERGVGSKE